MDMRRRSIEIARVSERMTATTEKAVIAQYKMALADIKKQMAAIYEKYAQSGVLTYAEMAKYSRLDGLLSSINQQIGTTSAKTRTLTKKLGKGVFEQNYYRTGWLIEQAAGRKLSYTLLNPKTIQASIENPIAGLTLKETLAAQRVAVIAKIKSEITQGLIQGEPYQRIANRLTETLGKDAAKAIRVVRTEAHRNSMQGAQASVEHSASRGVNMKKEWIATLDDRTRDTHAEMDGEIVDYDEDFHLPSGATGWGPGLTGDPGEDINCRCVIGRIVEGAEDAVERETYKEWAANRGLPDE